MAVLGGAYPISWSWVNQQTITFAIVPVVQPLRSSSNRFNTSALAHRSESFTAIRNSTNSSKKMQQTGDRKKRVAILYQAGCILMEDVPFAPLYTLSELYGLARYVIWTGTPDNKILVGRNETLSLERGTVIGWRGSLPS